jgi:hypothetical protein
VCGDGGISVTHSEETITLRQADGALQSLDWTQLMRVFIRTTDQGPFVADLFWELEASDGRGMTVPMGAAGESELLRTMQRRLAHFDNLAVVEAMGSTSAARFVVWEAAS